MHHAAPSYHGYRFPPEIMSHAVWLYHRFCLSFRDAQDLLAQRGTTVPTRLFGSGVGTSVLSTPVRSSAAEDAWATPGIWTNCS